MVEKLFRRKWVVGGRNGYQGVDEMGLRQNGLEGWSCIRFVDAFKTKKTANSVANACGGAYYEGIMDAHIGLTLPLVRDKEAGYSRDDSESPMKAGDVVKVVERNGGLFTVVRVRDGKKSSYISLPDLRDYEQG